MWILQCKNEMSTKTNSTCSSLGNVFWNIFNVQITVCTLIIECFGKNLDVSTGGAEAVGLAWR